LPRPQEVAFSQQLGSEAAADAYSSHDQSIEDEESDAVAHVVYRFLRRPDSSWHTNRLCNAVANGCGQPFSLQVFAQLGVVEQQLSPSGHEPASRDEPWHSPDHQPINVSDS
jgi:hypothetical protein